MSVIIETSIGEFTVDLYCDERPKCCLNFLKLCKVKYYNYCLFHSVQERLVAQTGDPTGSGNGGYSIWQKLTGEKYFQNELKPKIKHNKVGLLSMVNDGKNMHGSQFCITLSDSLDYLDGKHTVFGEISEGIEIIKKLNEVFVDKHNVPLKDVRIYHTIVIDDPFEDPRGICVPERSPEPRADQLDSGRVGAEEDLTAKSGATEEELAELERIKEARSNAQILAIIGDIPDEDIKPPDNVLFVCSLNPSTCSEDLELIFSRFGEILSCEVIRDHKTGSSLQYAFIEFADKESCEKAFFDMERVLIDDRRIHVDFSQSVSKQWSQYRADNKNYAERSLPNNDKNKKDQRYENKSRKEDEKSAYVHESNQGSDRLKRHRSKDRIDHYKGRDRSIDKSSCSVKRDRSRDRSDHRMKKERSRDRGEDRMKRDQSSERNDHRQRRNHSKDREDRRHKEERSTNRNSHHQIDRNSRR